jgi:hypothetical protein
MEGTRVVLAEPGMLEGVRAVNLMGVGEEEPKMAEGFARDEFKAREGVRVGGRLPKVCDEGFTGGSGKGGRPHRSGWIVETGWHC